MKGMKKLLSRGLSAVLCLLLAAGLAFGAGAMTADTGNLPEVTLMTDNRIRAVDSVTVTADGIPCEDVTLVPAGGSRQTIVMLDLSDSVTRETFQSICAALKTLAGEAQEGESLVLYTFGERVEQRLKGTETPEEIDAVIDSLEWDVKQTDFYDAVTALCEAANACPADTCLPVLISDGVDNASSADRAAAAAALQTCKSPVHAFCGGNLKGDAFEEYLTLITENGGMLTQLTEDGEEIRAEITDRLTAGAGMAVKVTLPPELGGREAVKLQVFRDCIVEEITVSTKAMPAPPASEPEEGEAAPEAPESESEVPAQAPEEDTVPNPVQPEPAPDKGGMSPLVYAAAGVIILLLPAALVLLRRRGKGKAAPARQKENAGEPAKKEKKKKDEPKVTFYFEDKK